MSVNPTWLATLREKPQSARDLAVTLSESTSRRNVAVIRHHLELMERAGLVQRTKAHRSAPWVWAAVEQPGGDQ